MLGYAIMRNGKGRREGRARALRRSWKNLDGYRIGHSRFSRPRLSDRRSRSLRTRIVGRGKCSSLRIAVYLSGGRFVCFRDDDVSPERIRRSNAPFGQGSAARRTVLPFLLGLVVVVTVRLTAFRMAEASRSDGVRAGWECRLLGKVFSSGGIGSMLLIPSISSTARWSLRLMVDPASPSYAHSHAVPGAPVTAGERGQGLGKLVKVAREALLHFRGSQHRELGLDGVRHPPFVERPVPAGAKPET